MKLEKIKNIRRNILRVQNTFFIDVTPDKFYIKY
jgi:hypothetical protein